jgi:hypothetical protein
MLSHLASLAFTCNNSQRYLQVRRRFIDSVPAQLLFYDNVEPIWRHSFFASYVVLDASVNKTFKVSSIYKCNLQVQFMYKCNSQAHFTSEIYMQNLQGKITSESFLQNL